MSLRIASYNLRALQDDVAALARTVRVIDPDVLCVQEVPWIGPSSHRIADFAARCGLVWSGRDRRAGQTSVLTNLRTRVLSVTHHRLPMSTLRDRRGFAVAEIAPFGRSPVSVASVHLGLDAAERVRHAEQVLGELARRPGPAVLAGDLNEQGDGRAWQLIGHTMRPVSPMSPTFPAATPTSVLDVVFATEELAALPHREANWVGEDLTAASDHRPVWADLEPPPVGERA